MQAGRGHQGVNTPLAAVGRRDARSGAVASAARAVAGGLLVRVRVEVRDEERGAWDVAACAGGIVGVGRSIAAVLLLPGGV